MSEEKSSWQLRFERERKARKESELLLENKSQELWQINQNLENQVIQRTKSLKEALQMAEMSNKAKDQFMANISHELKTPLNSINIISSIMKKNTTKNLDEKQVKNLGIINNCGKDLLFLVNDLLDLSKIDKGTLDLKKEEVDLQEFISEIYNKFLPQTNENALNFFLDIDKRITNIYTDSYRLNQIIENLLSNAIKFTNKGNISLIVKLEDENIRIIVKDEGIGISENQISTIFDRFKQVDGSTSRKYGGTGLGLSITKEIVSLISGEIFVSSKINQGTTFEVLLPFDMKESKESKEVERANDFDEVKNELSSLKTEVIEENKELDFEKKQDDLKKVLILNNNPITFISMIVVLRKKYEVIQASNIFEFLKINTNKNIKKAILDITTLKSDEYSILLKSQANNFILIHNDDIDQSMQDKSILKIHKKEIKESLNKI